MSDYDTLKLEQDPRGVLTVTLNRPEKRNAMSARMLEELTDLAKGLQAGQGLRAVVLQGAGSHFCAGGDLDWMMAQIRGDRDTRMREARKLAEALRALNEIPLPLIGRIHGGAFGGGVGLACICDVTLAAPGTKFGLTETRLGLIPATISPYVLARIGEGKARRVFMSARIFGAEEAQELGIIARVRADLDAAVEAEITPYFSASPVAVGAAKALARALGPKIDDTVISASIERLADTWETEDAQRGIAGFLNKTPPPWA